MAGVSTVVYDITGIIIIDPGSGYEIGEQVEVTITGDGTGAEARAYAEEASSQNILAKENITIDAQGVGKLISTIRSQEGTVTIKSLSGSLDLSSATTFIHAVDGSVVIEATTGSANIRKIASGKNVNVTAQHKLEVLGNVNSIAGDISFLSGGDLDLGSALADSHLIASAGTVTLRSTSGEVRTPKVVNAANGVSINSFTDLDLRHTIYSKTGPIAINSLVGSIDFGAAVFAENGSISMEAYGKVEGFVSGVTEIKLYAQGDGYSLNTIVVIEAPETPLLPGHVAATAKPIIKNQKII